MEEQFLRTKLLIGQDSLEKLSKAKVAVVGIGGVGSFVLEGLARAGIGNFLIVDNDKVEITNINRQLIATHKTLGKYKVQVAKERILEINPNANVTVCKDFFSDETKDIIDNNLDYVIDCIDTIKSKIQLIKRAYDLNIKIISSMGTGNKLDATKFEISDIYRTSICPLCKIMRKELKKSGIPNLKVLYSKEKPVSLYNIDNEKKQIGSISYVPSVAGLIISGEVIKDIIQSNVK